MSFSKVKRRNKKVVTHGVNMVDVKRYSLPVPQPIKYSGEFVIPR